MSGRPRSRSTTSGSSVAVRVMPLDPSVGSDDLVTVESEAHGQGAEKCAVVVYDEHARSISRCCH